MRVTQCVCFCSLDCMEHQRSSPIRSRESAIAIMYSCSRDVSPARSFFQLRSTSTAISATLLPVRRGAPAGDALITTLLKKTTRDRSPSCVDRQSYSSFYRCRCKCSLVCICSHLDTRHTHAAHASRARTTFQQQCNNSAMRARDVHSSTRCFWTASRRLSSRGGRERLGLPFQDCCEPDARWVCMSCVPTRSSERSILGRLRWVTRQCGVCDDARTHARTRAPAQRTAADAVMRSVPRALDFAQDRSARGRHGARVRARDVLFRGHRAARKDGPRA
jgi:hypothetical protein